MQCRTANNFLNLCIQNWTQKNPNKTTLSIIPLHPPKKNEAIKKNYLTGIIINYIHSSWGKQFFFLYRAKIIELTSLAL